MAQAQNSFNSTFVQSDGHQECGRASSSSSSLLTGTQQRHGTRYSPKRRSQLHRPMQDYALFEQAIIHGSAQAWVEIIRIYIPWARHNILARRIGAINKDALDALAHDALCRFWRSFTPQRFCKSRSLSQVLVYFDKCIASTIVNWLRDSSTHWEYFDEEVGLEQFVAVSTDVIDDLNITDPLELISAQEHDNAREVIREHLWRHCRSRDEQHVLHAWLVEGRSLRHIFQEDPIRWGGEPRRLYETWRNFHDRAFDIESRTFLRTWLKDC